MFRDATLCLELPADQQAGVRLRFRAALARLLDFDLGRFEGQTFSQCRACDPCVDLAAILGEVSLAAAALSDRLAMRFFSHVGDVSRQTFAA